MSRDYAWIGRDEKTGCDRLFTTTIPAPAPRYPHVMWDDATGRYCCRACGRGELEILRLDLPEREVCWTDWSKYRPARATESEEKR